ncbi:PREDICTED: coiled-coil domain-containing protein 102B [Pseudopodoces humilis]|uniref:coiled-coil domain-containing protein 102B n=1 Tax=Pseudopodoces humilis TaxID=181119 RepID=UPI0006B77DE2|nr:PREDICTED: coiled-coil domain-containing protein 102B [Pseudopodoces humilis]
MNQNMNLDSTQKQMEEIEVFGTQPTEPDKLDRCWQPGDHLCHSNIPSQSFYPNSLHYAHMHASYSSDWEIFEAVKIQELEEVKARAAQMEKTMRWWSDCTANWREKWSKVRGERNKAREEARQLRIKLDSMIKELSVLKKINQDLVTEKENGTAWKTECHCSEISCIKKDQNLLMFLEPEPTKDLNKIIKIPGAEDTKKDVKKDQNNDNKKFSPKPPDFFPSGLPSIYLEESKISLDTTAKTRENDLIHVSVLNLHLAEMRKILQKEREMNVFLEREMEKMENELFLWKWKYEELRQIKLESLKQGKEVEESEHGIWDQTKFLVCCWRFYHDSE